MSATGYTPIQLYRTTTAAATPSAGNLAAGELAINLTDEKLFFKNASGTVKVLASTGAGNAGGSNTQVQYNSSGVLTGSANFVFDGTNVGIGTSSPSYRLDVSGGVVGNTAGNSVSIGRLSGGAGSNSVQLLTTLNRISNGTDWTTTALRVQAQVDASLFGYIDFLNGSSAVMTFGRASSEFMRIDSSGNVGIGTESPTTLLDVFSATAANLSVRGNSATNITAHRSSTDASGPNSVLRKSRGTSDSQTAVASGDTMGTLFFSAYGGTNNRNIASIAGVVDTYSTDASIGSYLTFSTTPNGSVTPAERFRITSTGGITSSDLADAVGYKGLPQNAQTSSYTLALSDMGKHISITTGGVVIPANASVAFPIGSAIAIYNNSGSNQTISITSDTLRQAGTANTGSRTLAQYGLCTVTKVASTTWVISGAGVS